MKRATVYCGLPGSGKSTLARQVKGAMVIESDDYWYVDGEYVYDIERAGEVHSLNIVRWIDLCRTGFHNIACANTNITIAEIAPYVAIAAAYGYEVDIVRVQVSLATSKSRNTHDVPEEILEKMYNLFLHVEYPSWWNIRIVWGDEGECESYETCEHGD